jgi:hypothetical protein
MSDAPVPRWVTAITALTVASAAIVLLILLLYQWWWIETP